MGRAAQTIPVPAVFAFADRETAAVSYGAPEIVLFDTGVVLNSEVWELKAQAFNQSACPQR